MTRDHKRSRTRQETSSKRLARQVAIVAIDGLQLQLFDSKYIYFYSFLFIILFCFILFFYYFSFILFYILVFLFSQRSTSINSGYIISLIDNFFSFCLIEK